MTHIIGKPPAPKGGATFADVQPGKPFQAWRAGQWQSYTCDLTGAKGISWIDGRAWSFSPGDAVRLLNVQPIGPEPDPAVTTYRELEPKEWFHFLDTPFPALKSQRGYTRLDGMFFPADSILADMLVRRVAASVVVHEEPGFADYVTPDGDGFRILGGPLRTRADAVYIVRQLAALLAQEPASPESGEPESAGMCPCGLDSKSHPSFKHAASCPMAEPAEDRSKPAPGYDTPGRFDLKWYPRRAQRGPLLLCHPHDGPADAIAWTWEQHDAQQAGKGQDDAKA